MNNLFTPEELADMVDTLASIKAEIAELNARADTYKAALIAAEVRAIDGTKHRATISESYPTRTDWQTIAAKLQPSAQLVRAHTTQADEPTFTVRITARKVTA
jgi:hypothetical protein